MHKRVAGRDSSCAVAFKPLFDGVDDVPAVLLIIAKRATHDDACSDWWKGKWMRQADLGGGQRPTSVGEAQPPASAPAGANPYNSTYDSDICSPGTHWRQATQKTGLLSW